jgi:predicted CXXCH cytochrome family protein
MPDDTRKAFRARHVAAGITVAALLLTAWGTVAAPRRILPRGREDIPRVTAAGPHAGDCDRCHSMHGKDDIPHPHNLIGPNDNTLCLSCHGMAWTGESFGGLALYEGSAHGGSPVMAWPGPVPPARVEIDARGKCLNCHDPHGWEDASGPIPRLGLAREEELCLACHDTSPAEDPIRAEQAKPFRHPAQDYSGRHQGPLESLPADFGITPLNRRHAECVDCHNPHVARTSADAGPDDASKRLLGVSRVTVLNGPAGVPPAYTFVPASDTLSTPGGDWQVCFKCHSSWTTQPAGQADLGLLLNTNNPSYHPVQAPGRNPAISPDAFTPDWDAQSRTACGDCHGSDLPGVSGPHGSMNEHILRRPYDPSPAYRPVAQDELCFECHSHETYADPMAPDFRREASRFNRGIVLPGQSSAGHIEHVGDEQIPCGACHVTHGSTSLPFLLREGAVPGIVRYTATATGGTCTPTCHERRSYTVNYAR